MNIKFRITTGIEYEFVEIDHSPEEDWSPEQIRNAYDEYVQTFKVGGGLETKEWNECLDKYRTGGKMSVECGEKMNRAQAWFIKELDKSNNRIKTK